LPVAISQEKRREMVRARGMAPHERIVREDDARFSAHVLLNMSRPTRSPLLLGPLPKADGGWGTCADRYAGTDDPEYRSLLALMQERKKQYDEPPRFGMPGFRPNRQYIREMKRFGVLPAEFDPATDPVDPFDTDERYWRLFWSRPDTPKKWAYVERATPGQQ
jgi:hypothetical protein